MKQAEIVEAEIDTKRKGFFPVAVRASLLYFCVADMGPVDPMYKFSLQWFINLFSAGIDAADQSNELSERLANINNYFTLSLYRNVCGSLFEKHKLLFSFLLTYKILLGQGDVKANEWRHLAVVGAVPEKSAPNPAPDWIEENTWSKVLALENLELFNGFSEDLAKDLKSVRTYYDSLTPHTEPLPAPWNEKLTDFQKMLFQRSLRPDKMNIAVQDWVTKKMGKVFVEPPPFDLGASFGISSPLTPMIFVLTAGADPAAQLQEFAKSQGMRDTMLELSLGMGQGPIAERYIRQACEQGGWVLLQNCHLCISWLPDLEKLCEELQSMDDINPTFRLWLTSMPTLSFPVSILQNGIKMTVEPKKGLRANLLDTYHSFSEEFLSDSSRPEEWRKLLFSLCLFHALILDRRKFGPLGWNIRYKFRESDLRTCITNLHDFIDMFEDIPYDVLHYMIFDINYGGRVTDDKDRRTIGTLLYDFISGDVVGDDYVFSPSGKYRTIKVDTKEGYTDYIKTLDIMPEPEIFGLHDNANITFATQESDELFATVASILPRESGGGGKSREEIIADIALGIQEKCPEPIDIEGLMKLYPTKYEQSMNTVLVQETIRYNRLLNVIIPSLADIKKALKGEMVMTAELDNMGDALFNNIVPKNWEAVAYPSLMPLGDWVTDLEGRMAFINKWIAEGVPNVFWISGFFFPQAFLTGTKQNYARRHKIPIDTLELQHHVMKESVEELEKSPPEDGVYIRGLFLEGCGWDSENMCLTQSKPKELFVQIPVIWLKPVIKDPKRVITDTYKCPIYKELTRQGELSTTGHSTNFVMYVYLPSKEEEKTWIKAGVALFCALKYAV